MKSGSLCLKHKFDHHNQRVTAVHFTLLPPKLSAPDESQPNSDSHLNPNPRLVLLSASQDGTVKGVDTDDGLLYWSFEGHSGPVYATLSPCFCSYYCSANFLQSDTICTLLYNQRVPILISSSSYDKSIKSWVFPDTSSTILPEDEDDNEDGNSSKEERYTLLDLKVEGEVKEEPTADSWLAEGEKSFPEKDKDYTVTSMEMSIPDVPTRPIRVTEHVSFPNNVSCSHMMVANGRLLSCGKTADSFIHWNFVCNWLFLLLIV